MGAGNSAQVGKFQGAPPPPVHTTLHTQVIYFHEHLESIIHDKIARE